MNDNEFYLTSMIMAVVISSFVFAAIFHNFDIEVPINLFNKANILCETNNGIKELSVDAGDATIVCRNNLEITISKDEIKNERN